MKNKIFIALCAAVALSACAAAGTTRTGSSHTPAFYRHTIGDLKITAVSDGMIHLPYTQVKNISPEQMQALLKRSETPRDAENMYVSVNAYLLERNGETVLVDTGTADCYADSDPTLGAVPESLRAAGVKLENIRHVLMTHAHSDYICGLLENGKAAYPNATVWLSKTESDYWNNTELKARLPASVSYVFDHVQTALAPYQAAGRAKTFQAGDALPLGAKAIATPGHTVGQTAFLFENGATPFLVWGDIVHFSALQFAEPDVSFIYDGNIKQGQESRKAMFRLAEENGYRVAGIHLPFPGIGKVVRGTGSGEAYRWIPLEFTPETFRAKP